MLLSMSDIAFVARVRRPVVSMWRARFPDGVDAFPAPVVGSSFDADRVVDWLVAQGKGNNPAPARALPALQLLAEVRGDGARAAQLSALLAARAAVGDRLAEDLRVDPAEAIRAARRHDFLGCFADEVEAVAEPAVAADLVEDFVDEQFGVSEAFDWLTDEGLCRHIPAFSAAVITPEAADLVSRAATALAEADADPGVLDASGTGLSWMRCIAPDWEGRVGAARVEGDVARHTRRLLQVSGLDARLASGETGWPVVVDTVLDEGRETTFERATLTDDSQRRIVIGPARHLADPSGRCPQRDALLRDGVVRAVVKLPAGCRPAHPRELLALWLVAERDEVAFDQHRTYVADLTGVRLSSTKLSDLVADLRAAGLGMAEQRHRRWRVLRPVLTRRILAGAGSLVAPPVASASEDPVRVTPAQLAESAADAGITAPRMAAGTGAPPSTVTVQTARQHGWVKMISGVRLGAELPVGDLPVWGVRDGRVIRREAVDRLTALARPRTWLTEPGDVIVAPGPRAVIDAEGGALVSYPVRGYRLTPDAPFVARQLCAAIDGSARGTSAAQWRVAVLEAGRRDALSDATAMIDRRRAELTALLSQLDGFEGDLLTAVENNLVNLVPRVGSSLAGFRRPSGASLRSPHSTNDQVLLRSSALRSIPWNTGIHQPTPDTRH